MHYQTLSSEKYLQETLEIERKQVSQLRRQRRVNIAVNVLATISVAVTAFISVQTMPLWLPAVVHALHRWNLI